jgi:hypothetical protein
VDLAAVELFASMGLPVASGLQANSEVQPEPPRTAFAGTPVLLFGEAESDSKRTLEVRWDGGRMDLEIPAGDAETGEVLRLLRGARLITDWESRYPSEEAAAGLLARRRESRVARRLRELSETYGLASREMPLVAVVKRLGDKPGELPETRVVPVGMPRDTSFAAYFPAPAMPPPMPANSAGSFTAMFAAASLRRRMPAPSHDTPLFSRRFVSAPPPPPASDSLMDIAAMLEPDGGMPGDNPEARKARTAAAVLALAAAGHTLTQGAYRLHVRRLADFLQSVRPASAQETILIARVLDAAASGNAPAGPWLALAHETGLRWKRMEEALR